MLVDTISMLTNRSKVFYINRHTIKFQGLIALYTYSAQPYLHNPFKIAEVAELADALASGASVRKDVGVRIPASANLNFFVLKHLAF